MKWLAKFFDSLIDFGTIGEIFDRAIFRGIIAGIDDLVLAKGANPEVIALFDEFFTLIEERNYALLNEFVAKTLAEKIETPFGDEAERKLVFSALTFLNFYIQWAIEKIEKQANKESDNTIF